MSKKKTKFSFKKQVLNKISTLSKRISVFNSPFSRLITVGVIVLIIAGGVAIAHAYSSNSSNKLPVVVKHTTQTTPATPQPTINITEAAVIQDINQQRATKSLQALTENADLDKAATTRAQDMVTNGYTDNSSHSPWTFVSNAGYQYKSIWLVSTNSATTSAEVASQLDNETGSILLTNGSATDIGVGIITNDSPTTVNPSSQVVIYIGIPAATTSSSYPTPTPGESCSQIQAIFGPTLSSELSSDSSTWSNFTSYTQAENNYEYNQEAAEDYSLYTSAMEEFGCTPQSPSPTLQYPATDPGSATITPVVPTCNTALQTQYEQTYQDGLQEDNEWASQQNSNLLEELDIAGAGDSSAVQEGEQAITEQLDQKNGQLLQTLNDDLTDIDCPTQQ